MADRNELQGHLERLRSRIGMIGPGARRKIEAGALIKFARATGQTDPLYLDEEAARQGPFGALIACPTYLSVFANEALVGLLVHDLPLDMFLHTDDVVEMGVPIRVGDEITATARYADAVLREGRRGPMLYQYTDMTLRNQHGHLVAQLRIGAVSFDSKGTTADAN
jgi:acyl dehydratase